MTEKTKFILLCIALFGIVSLLIFIWWFSQGKLYCSPDLGCQVIPK